MTAILSLTIPFFAIILAGSIAAWRGWFSTRDGQMLARFAFFVALPPFMIVAITRTDVASSFELGFILRYELATIAMFMISAVFVWLFLRLSGAERGMFCLNTAYPNYGYIGVPLALLAFGEKAALPVSLLLVFDTITLLVMTTLLSHNRGAGRLSAALKQTFLSMVKNPLLMSVLAGFAMSVFGVKLAQMPDMLMTMLAGAAAPTALFALGITLVGQPVRGALREILPITVLKLILHPALVAGIFILWPTKEQLDPLWIQVAILFACLPIAANVFALSQYYNVYQGRTATTIMLTTILASFTVPAVLYFLVRWAG